MLVLIVGNGTGEPVSELEPGVFGSFEPKPLAKNRSWSRFEKNQEPEPLKKLACSSALLEDKKHKAIVL